MFSSYFMAVKKRNLLKIISIYIKKTDFFFAVVVKCKCNDISKMQYMIAKFKSTMEILREILYFNV